MAARLERVLVRHLEESLWRQLGNTFRVLAYGTRHRTTSQVEVFSVRGTTRGRVDFVAEARTFHPHRSGHTEVVRQLLTGSYTPITGRLTLIG
jgi:hypothetical protein